MTVEEFLALPEDGVERWLIRGELREKRDTDMSLRSKAHGITEARITGILSNWLHRQPQPRGEVLCGEPGFVIRESPTTISAGVDVAIISAAQADALSRDRTMIDGPPVMIAEVLSPHDTVEEVTERVEEYLECGVKVIWVVNPQFKTVTIHRSGVNPVANDARDTLVGDPELPGFSCAVADFFR
jgi:Uma2 family endonuclease